MALGIAECLCQCLALVKGCYLVQGPLVGNWWYVGGSSRH